MSEKLNTLSHKLIRYKIEENIGCALNLWTQIFLMSVCILAPNALARVKSQRKTITKHYMDL
jgi:hypothetical protein